MTVLVFEHLEGDDGSIVDRLIEAAISSVRTADLREHLMIARAEDEHPAVPPFSAAVIAGSVLTDAVEAHLLLYPAEVVIHLDSHTGDVTALKRVATRIEPSVATRLDLSTVDDLAVAVGRLARAIVLEAAPESAPMSVELGKILSGWETRRDVLVDELFARRAQALAQEGREPQALALLESRAAVHDSAFVARAQALLLGQVDRDDPSRAVAALRRAVADPLNPERATDLANLVQVVPILDEPEGERLLTELASDPTYAEAWWISRLRGMLAYRRATRAYAHEGRNAARSHAVEAARLYDNAIRGHESARKLAIDRELDPWPDVPASPILSANAYDAHHLAGHMTRAKRRHDAAMDRCIELANYAFEAALAGALDAARVACSRVIGVGWTADPTVSALTLTSVIADRQGDVEEARVTWQRARQIDAMKAALFRRRAVEALAGTAQ